MLTDIQITFHQKNIQRFVMIFKQIFLQHAMYEYVQQLLYIN